MLSDSLTLMDNNIFYYCLNLLLFLNLLTLICGQEHQLQETSTVKQGTEKTFFDF